MAQAGDKIRAGVFGLGFVEVDFLVLFLSYFFKEWLLCIVFWRRFSFIFSRYVLLGLLGEEGGYGAVLVPWFFNFCFV